MTADLANSTQWNRAQACVTGEQKGLLHGASMAGQSVSDAMFSSAQEAALHKIHAFEPACLTIDERKLFVSTMLNPPAPGARLKKAAKAYRAKQGESKAGDLLNF